MQYYKLKEFQNIESFQVKGNESSLRQKNGTLIINWVENSDFSYYSWLNNEIKQYSVSNEHFIGDGIKVPKNLSPIGFNEIFAFYIDDFRFDELLKATIFNIQKFNFDSKTTETVLGNFSGGFLDYFEKNDSIICSQNKNELFAFSCKSKLNLWQTSLESFGTIRKILGVCGENLWVTTSDKTEHSFSNKLVALSIETGTVLYVIYNDYTFDTNWVQLLEKEEKIVSIKGSSNQATYLYEYCGKTGTELRKQTIVSLENNGLSIICAKVVENMVYFTATDHTQIVANHVGVMDLETLEVVWFEKVSPGNLKLEPPQVGANKIYVLGAEGTLHIYEREM